MKAFILAAGEGTRLKKYTENLPKGMLKIGDKSLIERQIDLYRKVNIDDITIIKGFAPEQIDFPGVAYCVNEDWRTTNMLVSLFCAQSSLLGDMIISYADILFEQYVLERLIASSSDITVVVDENWKEYWLKRYGSEDFDTESLKLGQDGHIVSLGKDSPPLSEIDARYVGLMKFSSAGVRDLQLVWDKYRSEYWDIPWQVSGKPLKNAYMTDMLQALIDEGHLVQSLKIKNSWVEFDTNEDYENVLAWRESGELESIIKLEC